MHLLVVGPTSRIAEQCIRLWLNNATHISLVGRNAKKLEALGADLRVRRPEAQCDIEIVDFNDPNHIAEVINDRHKAKNIDIALVAQGFLPASEPEACPPELIAESMWINGLAGALFAEALCRTMSGQPGQLGVLSSVAGDRGRASNYLYGSAKSLTSAFVEGLQHKYHASPLFISLIKPGPVMTPMTLSMPSPPKSMATPEKVARDIVTGMAKGQRVIYTPGRWRWIMLAIRCLPFFLFKRLKI